ncbi:MAG TPA: MFS transporter [Candidatus Binataceae bacterium]|nr:MFS transporter [Candidatus Binataceae bacterium]
MSIAEAPVATPAPAPSAPRHSRYSKEAFIASFLGWTLDAFDFFVLIFVLPAVAHEFHRPISDIAYTITITLIFRPLGALLFGWLADIYGRRLPLLADVIFYSVVEVLSGLAPSYRTFLLLRAFYGVGMGGEWGVGASLAMEAVPTHRRGFFSGLLQEGYALGYLLAAAAYFLIFPAFGWRALFFAGGLPALLTFYIRTRVPESEAWERHRPNARMVASAIWFNLSAFAYLAVLLTVMNLLSHGTQDLYPTFLERERQLGAHLVAAVAIIYNLGAISGGLVFGAISDRMGRKRTMMVAVAMVLFLVPLWIFPQRLWLLVIGAFLMQFMVQGAWGVIPAHLVELSPPAVRGLFPGLAYQLGVLLAANCAYTESLLGAHLGYGNALALVAGSAAVIAVFVVGLGREQAGLDLHA